MHCTSPNIQLQIPRRRIRQSQKVTIGLEIHRKGKNDHHTRTKVLAPVIDAMMTCHRKAGKPPTCKVRRETPASANLPNILQILALSHKRQDLPQILGFVIEVTRSVSTRKPRSLQTEQLGLPNFSKGRPRSSPNLSLATKRAPSYPFRSMWG